MADVQAPDGAIAGFVAACDRALDLGRDLLEEFRAKGDRRAAQVQTAIDVVESSRSQALDGSLPRSTPDGPTLGLSRGISEFDFRPEDPGFARAVRDIEEYWMREMVG